ncbi:MAG: helix-turn-helix transcriptional regulator [Bacteroidetes bacterium]|nr:helix-turn-helix transcriptional regulator [Bacteroidota bacterium]
MVNFIESVLRYPEYSRQFNCGESLITVFNCPLEARLMKNRFTDLWSQNNYVFYVIDGRKIWHTVHGSYDLKKGSCVFVQKGASIIEQFFDIGFCLVLFFIPDKFICETLKSRSAPISNADKDYGTVMQLNTSETLETFFLSMSSYFASTKEPDKGLLELKFRELILTLADDPYNGELISYFHSLVNEPQSISLQRVMEDNYCFNLTLEQYAELCNRSLSAFKRDFQKIMHSTPGKWLLEKRLNYAIHLLANTEKTVNEVAFECGFENASHFSRSFKERYQVSPSMVRKTFVA